MRTTQDEAPFSEARDVDVVGIRLQTGLFERLGDAPEGVAGKHRRSALDYHQALRAEMAGGGAVKSCGVKFAQGIIGGVGKIDDDEIETVGIRIDPGKSVGVDNVNARREKRFVV